MKLFRLFGLASLSLVLVFGTVRAETKVELKGVHICCGMCTKAISDTLKKVEGVTGTSDQKAKTITLTAKDAETAQKAVDALLAVGFHGTTDSKDVKIAEDSGIEKGKVKSLTLTGIHNCCGMCATAINATVKKVEGVKAGTAKGKVGEFEVTGEFEATDVVKALNDAGFHVKAKK